MVDCLIIGGGVIGLSIAWELSRHKQRVCVIDRGEPGRQASWAGAGILPPAGRHPAADSYEQLAALSYDLHEPWAKTLLEMSGTDTGFRRCGGIHLARGPGEAAALRATAEELLRQQIRIEEISPQSLAQIEPALAPMTRGGKLAAAYLLPDEAQVRNPRHLAALVAACRLQGVEIRARVTAEDYDTLHGRVQAVRTSAGPIEAASICITTGAWTRLLLQPLGIPLGIKPIRGQIVLLRCPRKLLTRIINEGPRYLVPREDGRVLAGSTVEDVGFDCTTTDEALDQLRRFATELAPPLADVPVERAWAGLRPGTLDGLPYLGRIPGLENAFVAAGHYRSGLYLSPGTAVVMGRLIRGEDPQLDLNPFRLDRG